MHIVVGDSTETDHSDVVGDELVHGVLDRRPQVVWRAEGSHAGAIYEFGDQGGAATDAGVRRVAVILHVEIAIRSEKHNPFR